MSIRSFIDCIFKRKHPDNDGRLTEKDCEDFMVKAIKTHLSGLGIEDAEVMFMSPDWYVRFKNSEDENLFKLANGMYNLPFVKVSKWRIEYEKQN